MTPLFSSQLFLIVVCMLGIVTHPEAFIYPHASWQPISQENGEPEAPLLPIRHPVRPLSDLEGILRDSYYGSPRHVSAVLERPKLSADIYSIIIKAVEEQRAKRQPGGFSPIRGKRTQIPVRGNNELAWIFRPVVMDADLTEEAIGPVGEMERHGGLFQGDVEGAAAGSPQGGSFGRDRR